LYLIAESLSGDKELIDQALFNKEGSNQGPVIIHEGLFMQEYEDDFLEISNEEFDDDDIDDGVEM
jgi:hypothetical protein